MGAATPSDIKLLASNIINQAKKMGATAAEVTISQDSGFSVNVRKNNVETIEHNKGKKLSATVYFGYRSGSASTSDFKPNSINLTLEKACHIARFTEEDPYVGLAEKELMATNFPDLDLYHPWPIKIEEAITLAKNCEKAGPSYDKRITNSEGAAVNTYASLNAYANSHDFCGAVASTRHGISCSLIAEHNQEMQRDYYYTTARDANDLEHYEVVATKAAKRTVERLGAKKITTQKCPVIFIAEVASSLINNFIRAISGPNLYQKATFLPDHLHHQVFAKHITIEEDPSIPKALGSSPFDAEGVKLYKTEVIANGILERYVLDSYSARKLKMKTTGNAGGIHNLIIKPGSFDLTGLLKKMGTGLLVTEFMGGGANTVTGDYSRGVFGYWIENGNIHHPVTGVTVAGNLKDIFLNIQEVGNDVDYRSTILTGSILLGEMMVAGT